MEQLQYKLEVFEGPLDLLLHLIEKNKINISDIPIALLLEQYMSYVEAYKEIDMDNLSEFLVVASHLLYIKSKILLPKQEEEEADPREELVNMLLEYKKYKSAAQELGEKLKRGAKSFVKQPDLIEFDNTYNKIHPIGDLVDAYQMVYTKNLRKMPPPIDSFKQIVGKKIVSVGTKVAFLLKNLLRRGKINFKELFYSQKSRSEIVASFLAVLELSKVKRITLQDREDGETEIILNRRGRK